MALFTRFMLGAVAAATGAALAVMVPSAWGQSAARETGVQADVQARVQAAQAAAAAATARAQARIAAAQAQIKTAEGEVQVMQNSGSGVNVIRVTDNQAGQVVVECQGEPGAQVNVNSVVADGKSLQGKTVIVTGRNARDVQVRGNCKQVSGGAGAGSANVNSVVIR